MRVQVRRRRQVRRAQRVHEPEGGTEARSSSGEVDGRDRIFLYVGLRLADAVLASWACRCRGHCSMLPFSRGEPCPIFTGICAGWNG